MRSCTSKTSASSASKTCCQRVTGAAAPAATSTSSGERRIRLAALLFCQRTVAVRR